MGDFSVSKRRFPSIFPSNVHFELMQSEVKQSGLYFVLRTHFLHYIAPLFIHFALRFLVAFELISGLDLKRRTMTQKRISRWQGHGSCSLLHA